MSPRRLVRLLASGAAVLASVAPGLAVTTPAAAAPANAATDRGFAQIAGCVSGADTLLAAVVVDESGSLRSTDPRAQRVPAITTAIDALEDLRASTSGRLDVQVSMSTFARGYTTLVGWGQLNERHARRLRGTAARELPRRDAGDATDYRQAMQGAQRQLDSRARRLSSDSVCKVMLWFTDGALDVGPATGTAARELCRPRGIVDAVRRDQISVIALALFTRGGSVTPRQRDQLRAVAEGRGASTACGSTPIPSDASSGVHLSADDPEALRRLFAGATALMSGATGGPAVTCPGPGCPGGRFSFGVDAGVGGFRLVADVGTGRAAPALRTPDGQAIQLPSAGSRRYAVSGGDVHAFTRDGLTTVTMTSDALPTRNTRWTLDLGRAGGAVDVYWLWGTSLRLDVADLAAGGVNQIRGAITGPAGTPVDPRLYDELDIRTTVGSESARAAVNPDGTFTADVVLPVESGRTQATVEVLARARTSGTGLLLGPLSLADTVPVTLPPAFPSLAPDRLDLPAVEGVESRSAVVDVTGTKLGPTSVCFAGSTVAGPTGRVDATPAGPECLRLGAGERGQLRVDLVPSVAADGLASGDLRFGVTGAADAGSVQVGIPTEFDMVRPVDESTRWLLIALLVGAALLVPVLLLLLAEWLLGRFVVTPTHQRAVVPVRLTEHGPQRLSGGADLLTNRDLANLPLSGTARRRRYDVPGADAVLRVRRWWDVARGSKGVVTVPPGRLVATKVSPYTSRRGREADVPLGPVNSWFVVTSPTAARDSAAPEATLVMLVPADNEPLSERVADVRRAPWESILEMLRRHAGTPEGTDDAPGTTETGKPATAPDVGGQSAPPAPTWLDEATSDTPITGNGAGMPSFLSDPGTATAAPGPRPPRRPRLRARERGREPSPGRTSNDDLPPMNFL
jgi:von Willebrand factor type A domain